MEGFWLLLAITVFLRGLGSGMITGILFITMPVRSRMELISYAQFIRTMYKAWGVKVYAGTTMLGLLLTAILVWWALAHGESDQIGTFLIASLIATILGFVGTAGALPAMKKLWMISDDQPDLVGILLTRFERWGMFSAACHVVAFTLIIIGAWCGR